MDITDDIPVKTYILQNKNMYIAYMEELTIS